MSTRYAVILTVLMTSASATAAPATDGLSLAVAQETALAHSPDLKAAELSEDSAGWGKLGALSEHLPQISARGTHFMAAKYSVLGVVFGGNPIEFPSAFPQTEFDLEASLTLFDGLGAINRYRAASLESEAARLELEHARFELGERVRVRYDQALAAQELAKVADQNIETLESHLKLARVSRRAGYSTNVDVLRIESQLEEARAERILAADNVVTARRALHQTMGVDPDDRPLVGGLPVPARSRVPADLALDVSRRDDLQAQTRRDQASDRLNAAAASFWFPKVALFGTEQFYKYGNFDPAILPNDTFQNAYGVGLRMTWNLFDGGASIARKAQASDSAKIASERTRKALLASPNEFDEFKRKYIYNSALYEARKRSVEKSAESVRLATLAVRAGTKTHSEALDAELELFRARAGVIRAQADASEALASLELALGHAL